MACACVVWIDQPADNASFLAVFEQFKKQRGCEVHPSPACEAERRALEVREVMRLECQAIANDNAYRSRNQSERDKQGFMAPGFFTGQKDCSEDTRMTKVSASPETVVRFYVAARALCSPSESDLRYPSLVQRDFPVIGAAK